MHKHRGFPSRMPGTDYQFTIRRDGKKGVTELKARERYRDRRNADLEADTMFLAALYNHFGEHPFPRGNLDAGRLSWVFGREVVPAETPFDPKSYEAMLKLNLSAIQANFPVVFDVEFEE